MRVFGRNSTQSIIVQSRIIQIMEVLVRQEAAAATSQEAHLTILRAKIAKHQ